MCFAILSDPMVYAAFTVIIIVLLGFAWSLFNGKFGPSHGAFMMFFGVLLILLLILRQTDSIPLPKMLFSRSEIPLDWSEDEKFEQLFQSISTPAYVLSGKGSTIERVNVIAHRLFLEDTEYANAKQLNLKSLLDALNEKGKIENYEGLLNQLEKGKDSTDPIRSYTFNYKHNDELTITFETLVIDIVIDGEVVNKIGSLIPISITTTASGPVDLSAYTGPLKDWLETLAFERRTL